MKRYKVVTFESPAQFEAGIITLNREGWDLHSWGAEEFKWGPGPREAEQTGRIYRTVFVRQEPVSATINTPDVESFRDPKIVSGERKDVVKTLLELTQKVGTDREVARLEEAIRCVRIHDLLYRFLVDRTRYPDTYTLSNQTLIKILGSPATENMLLADGQYI